MLYVAFALITILYMIIFEHAVRRAIEEFEIHKNYSLFGMYIFIIFIELVTVATMLTRIIFEKV